MKSFPHLLSALAFCAMTSLPIAPAFSADAPLTDAQKKAVEDVVREMLTQKEPEIVFEAAKHAEAKLAKKNSEKSAENIDKYKDKLFKDSKSPVGGNPKGDVTLVEFFDYSCGYCKVVNQAMVKAVKEDKKVKIIYKEYPILGEVSATAAKAALASVKQGKYEAFHNALMGSKDRLTDTLIFDIAKTVGLDVEKLKKTMKDDEADMVKTFEENSKLAHDLGIQGTPGFVIGKTLIPGALPEEGFKQAFGEARKTK